MNDNIQASAAAASLHLWFESKNVSSKDVRVEAIEGREVISQPYRFEATLVAQRAIRASDLVGERAKLGIDVGDDKLVANGVVLEFHVDNPTAAGDHVYRVVLAPRLKLLDFTMQNQIYGSETPVTLPDIISLALDGGLLKQSSRRGGREITVDGELRLNGSYRSREHVVQYRESDLAFLSRQCEHDGVFFFFEQQDSGETVVFGDGNVAFAMAELPNGGLDYRHGHVATAKEAVITSLRCEQRALPERVYLSEYNEMIPTNELVGQAEIEPEGFGLVVEYGQNFLTPDEGNSLAKVRAQEIACRGRVVYGESTAPQLRPGLVFTVAGHPDSAMNGRYVATEVVHEAATPFAAGQSAAVQYKDYHNRFQAIPYDIAFRPPRITPIPVAAGIYSATIDGAGSGDRAELDEHGRYKVRVYYDDGMSPDGKATEYIRKAEPYAGKGDSGMHFPLLKGTEVVLAFLNGDPDRPIIVGAVPNPATPNVVTSANQTRNRISSTTNVLFEINDGPAVGGSGSSGDGMPAQNHYAMASQASPAADEASITPQRVQAIGEGQALPLQNHYDGDPSDFTTATNYALISVPGAAQGYLRLGSAADTDLPWSSNLNLSATLTTPTTVSGPVTTTTPAQDLYNQKPASNNVSVDSADGVLLGTNDSLVVNIGQSVLTKVQAGVTTQVVTNDHNTTVQGGAFNVTASEGIYMNAGGGATETNIILTASGYVKQSSQGDQHIYSGSNSYTYINADKIQEVHGNTSSTTYGTNTSEVHGHNKSTVWGDDQAYKMGSRVAMNLGAGVSLNLSVDMKLILGGEISFQIPFAIKTVIGIDLKMVWGTDMKLVSNDIKVVTTARYEIQPKDVKIKGESFNWAQTGQSIWDVVTESNLVKVATVLIDSAAKQLSSETADVKAVN